jgi:hypothetical protein
VLYTKTDNELVIDVDDVNAENMEVTISEGSIASREMETSLHVFRKREE